jgi:hypothetical protein
MSIGIVIVQVSGGVAEVIEQPKGVTVQIRDYDVEGCDESELVQDERGDWYSLAEYEGGA